VTSTAYYIQSVPQFVELLGSDVTDSDFVRQICPIRTCHTITTISV